MKVAVALLVGITWTRKTITVAVNIGNKKSTYCDAAGALIVIFCTTKKCSYCGQQY
jgi:hypothetical protein